MQNYKKNLSLCKLFSFFFNQISTIYGLSFVLRRSIEMNAEFTFVFSCPKFPVRGKYGADFLVIRPTFPLTFVP